MTETILKISFPYNKSASSYDPMKIYLSPEYTFLENIYSPLVEYSPNGELVSAIAESFNWIGTEAHFKIRPGLKTIDGRDINAKDVEATFKRIMILKGNTHGNLKEMLCPTLQLKRITDPCPQIVSSENGLTLTLKFSEKKVFLFPMLAAMDFAIIPQGSIDPNTLEIIDYRNTSGPYYVSKDSPYGHIMLDSNTHHFHYTTDMPQKVALVPSITNDRLESIKLLNEGKISAITTIDQTPHDEMMKYAQINNDVFLHKTLPLRTYAITYTKKGKKRFPLNERLSIAKELRDLIRSWVKNLPGYELTDQLFPQFGEGGLTDQQSKIIVETLENVKKKGTFQDKLSIWFVRLHQFDPNNKAIKDIFPNSVVTSINKSPAFVNFENEKNLEEPDIAVMGTDMGFLEDIGLLSYGTSAGIFDIEKDDADKWIDEYMSKNEKDMRLAMTKDLHFKTLKNAVTIPIAISPYTALVKKPWTMNLSKLQASDAIWRFRKN